MTSTQPFTSSSPGTFKSVLAAITSFPPSSSSTSPCSGDSPVEGEKHTQFCAISPYDCDTDSPSCYDSDSLLDFTGSSSQLESVDTLETSVSWYCRGDSEEAEDEDNEAMLVSRSGDRTPLSPNNYLDYSPPLLDSKVFILHPVKVADDDFDFTCAGLEEEGAYQVDDSRSVFRAQQLNYRHHHQRRSNTVHHNHTHNHNHNHNPRPHLHPHIHKQPHVVAQTQKTTSPLRFSVADCSKRRWSAPISTAFAGMLARAGFTTTTGAPTKTPVSSANHISSDYDRDTDVDSDDDASSDIQAREETRGRASNKKKLQSYFNNTNEGQDLSTIVLLQIPEKRRESTLSTPRTWPRCRNSKAIDLTLDLWNGTDFTTNLTDGDYVVHAFGDKAVRERSMTMGSSFPSNKWGNQPPNGYI